MSSRLGEFANIYELLDESDSSGVETGKKAKEAVEQKKAAAAAALAPTVVAKPANTQGQKPSGDRRSPRTDRPPRGPRPEGDRAPRPEGERRPRPPRQEGDRPPRPEGERRPRPDGDRPRRPRVEGESFAESGQAAARGEPRSHLPRDQVRGPRPDRGYERRNNGDQDTRPGKREYDRRSGTGRGKETAKGGAGAGNWGSDEAEAHSLEGQSATTAAAVADGVEAPKEGEETVATTDAAAAPAAEATEAAAPVDDEPPVRTLAAYLSEKKGNTAAQATRKAGDGQDESAYKNYQPFKKEEESLFAVEKSAKEKKTKEKDSKEKKVSADQVLRFQQERRDREERGGSRGGRGGRGGQGGQRRGGNSQGSALNFTDAAAFPGLSTKA